MHKKSQYVDNFKCKIMLESRGKRVVFSVILDTGSKKQADDLIRQKGETISQFFATNFERALSSAIQKDSIHIYG